jgi:TM2 domain-containing membrane protein YozV
MDAGTHVERNDATHMAEARFIRVRGTTAEWRCQSCDSWQDFDQEWCVQCAQPRRRFGSPVARLTRDEAGGTDGVATPSTPDVASPTTAVVALEPGEIDEPVQAAGVATLPPSPVNADASQDWIAVDPAPASGEHTKSRSDLPIAALAASVVLPGAGHVLLGRITAGLARMAVAVAWVVAAASWINHHAMPAQRGAWAAVVGVALLWVLTLVDVVRLARDEPAEILTAARLFVLVSVVTAMLVIAPRVAIAAGGGS